MANIQINDIPSRAQYQAAGGQTVFSYTFPIKAQTDLAVYKRDPDAMPVDANDILQLTIDYSVSGVNTASGGTVTLVVPAADGDIVTIVGARPIDRLAIYDQSVTLSKSDLNNDFNNNVMFEKQTETFLDQITPKYNRNELVGPDSRPDKLVLPMLKDGEVWAGRGELGENPDDIVAISIGSLIDLDADFVLGTANLDFPNAQPLGGLGTGILYNSDDGTTGTLSIVNIGAGLTLNTGTKTLSTTGTGFNLTWYTVTINTAMQTSSGYIPNSGGLLLLTLPTTAAVGDALMVAGRGAGGFQIIQNSGQVIHFGSISTTSGVGGSVSSTNRYDSVIMVCTVANLEWTVLSSQGQLDVI
jgi:hypothetical protein